MTAYAGLTIGQGTAAGLSGDHDTRADQGVGAATSFIGVLGLLFLQPSEVDAAARTLRAMPSESERARPARDEAAIFLREQAAGEEREGRSWIPHALNLAVAGGSSLVLWKGFDRGDASAVNFAVSFAIGELQIWTQPAGLIGNSQGPVTGAASSEVPTALQRSLRLAWNGQLLRLMFAF